jgi:hypothetical protein
MDIELLEQLGSYIASFIILISVIWTKVKNGVGLKHIKEGQEKANARDEIKQKLHQRIEVVVIEKMKYIKHIDVQYRNLLVSWSEKFEEFAINSYFSEYRKSHDVEHYLTHKAGSLMADMDFMLLQRFPEIIEGKSIINLVSENTSLVREMELLVRALVKNGLKDDEYISLFEDSVSRILEQGIYLFQKWNSKLDKDGI